MAALVEEINPVKNRMELLRSIRAVFKIPLDMPLSKYQMELLVSNQYDDFPWDCIIYVIGHSDIIKKHLKPKKYNGMKVVSLFGTEMGTSCFTFTKHIKTLFRVVSATLTPVDIALVLNATLRERDPALATTLKDPDAGPFLESGVKISPSIDEYFDKKWDFYEEEDGVYENSGSVVLYKRDGTSFSLLLEDEESGPCKKTILSKTTILERALAANFYRPIFIDLGCNTFAGKKSEKTWEDIKGNYPTGSIGGKRKTRRLKKIVKVWR